MDPLIAGYIRRIENQLRNDEIIPVEIYELCIDYYPFDCSLLLLSKINTVKSYAEILIANTEDLNDNWKLQLNTATPYVANSSDKLDKRMVSFMNRYNKDGQRFGSQFCIAKGITKHRYNLLFSSGGFGICLPFSINRSVNNFYDKYIGKQWLIPPLTYHGSSYYNQYYGYGKYQCPLKYNHVTWSNMHGLISVGGDAKRGHAIYNLPFDNVEFEKLFAYNPTDKAAYSPKNFRWKLRLKLMKGRKNPSSLVIRDHDGNERLFVVGGYDSDNWCKTRGSLEIIKLNKNGWKHGCDRCYNVKIPRAEAGLYYDELKNRIYIAGGSQSPLCGCRNQRGYWRKAKQSLEYFDLVKMKSYTAFPLMSNAHSRYPTVWSDFSNPNILNVASMTNKGFEFIDMREKCKRWIQKSGILQQMFKHQTYGNVGSQLLKY